MKNIATQNTAGLTISELRGVALTATGKNKAKAIKALTEAVKQEREAIDRQVEGINIIREYNEKGRLGIGYKDGKLVEYAVRTGLMEVPWLEVKEITLAESVEWVSQMLFAEIRLEWCGQDNDAGRLQWFRELAAELN